MIKYAFFILSFNIYSATSDGCDSVEMLFIDNPKFAFVNNETEFKFEAKMNYTVKLRFTNVDGPVEIRLNSSWHPLGVHPNTFNIEGNTVEEISLLAWVPYVYTVDVYCSTVQQSSSLGHEDSTLTQTNSTLLDTIRAIVKKPRQEQVLTKIFGLVTNVLMAFAMLVMGTDLEFDIILAYLRRPIGPVIGIISQFIGMPVIAYVVGYLILSEQPFARLGLLLIGSSPGGSASNFWTVLFKGDKNLSVTMTFCSSVASFGMTTFWIYILGSTIISEAFDLPYLQLFVSLISLVLPIFVGLLITKKKPKWGARIRQYSRPVFLFIVLLSVGVGIYVQRFFFVMVSWSDFVSGILLSASGYLLGALLAFAARLNKSQIIAVAIETAIQNPGIAIVVIQSNLESPYSEIGILPVISFLFTTGPPMAVAIISMKIYECFRSRSNASKLEEANINTISSVPGYSAEQPGYLKEHPDPTNHAGHLSDNPGFEGDNPESGYLPNHVGYQTAGLDT